MSNSSIFKELTPQYVHLESVSKQAKIIWETFQRLAKQSNNNQKQLMLDDDESGATAERYFRTIQQLTDPTAIETGLNAAFSNLDKASLKKLETRLLLHYKNAEKIFLNRQREPKTTKSDIELQDDNSYIKVPEL